MGIIWYMIYFSLEHIFFLMSILVHKFKNDNQYLNNGSKISNLRKQTRLLEKFFKYVGHTYMDCTMQSISKVGWFVSNTENQKKIREKKRKFESDNIYFLQNLRNNEHTIFPLQSWKGLCEFSVGSVIIYCIAISTLRLVVTNKKHKENNIIKINSDFHLSLSLETLISSIKCVLFI